MKGAAATRRRVVLPGAGFGGAHLPIGFRDRLAVMVDWFRSHSIDQCGARLITGPIEDFAGDRPKWSDPGPAATSLPAGNTQ